MHFSKALRIEKNLTGLDNCNIRNKRSFPSLNPIIFLLFWTMIWHVSFWAIKLVWDFIPIVCLHVSLCFRCAWLGEECKENDIRSKIEDMGQCFSFNTDRDNILKTSKTGAEFGLRLVLNIEQYEYIRGPSTDAGIKVWIHNVRRGIKGVSAISTKSRLTSLETSSGGVLRVTFTACWCCSSVVHSQNHTTRQIASAGIHHKTALWKRLWDSCSALS